MSEPGLQEHVPDPIEQDEHDAIWQHIGHDPDEIDIFLDEMEVFTG